MAVVAAACAAVLTVVLVQRAAPSQSPLLGARVARPSSTVAALRLSTRAAPPQMMPIKEFSRKKRYVNSFNDNGFLNVIMPLTPRHFSDVTKLDLYSARVRCENCTKPHVQFSQRTRAEYRSSFVTSEKWRGVSGMITLRKPLSLNELT